MTETQSKTANHQRLAEMFVHLTPLGARIPYSISIDNQQNIWVATKGGLFKMDRFGKLLFQEKNDFAKKAEPFCQVSLCEEKIIYAYSECMSGLTLLKVMTLDGKTISEQFVDGKIQSLSVNDSGEMFLTKRPKGEDSIIYSSDICCPSCWSEVICEDEYVFQTVCALSSDLLVVSTCTLPINIYSRYGSDILVLDKTGRIQQFTQNGDFVRVATKIDAYLGNAFVVDGNMALIACSGIVLDEDNKTICDDWLEKVPLDGSQWLPDADFVDKK
ncbi:unnamed protein product [Acanthocheilonema viteae]|uniref:Uncharacterized protein n=1 Tax=Acanthocheilonema viteae TaxID=6277 RepID=A0A498SKH8_ACAVI|nr:unnamed protein product [Acanthocheilonema viteae]